MLERKGAPHFDYMDNVDLASCSLGHRARELDGDHARLVVAHGDENRLKGERGFFAFYSLMTAKHVKSPADFHSE